MKIFLLAVLICTWSEVRADEITYLGLSGDGLELSHAFNEKEYEQHLTETFGALDSVVEQESSKLTIADGKFRLSQIVLGLGASGEIGIGPFKLGAGIRHRTYYKRSL